MIWHGHDHDPSQHHQLKKMLCKIGELRKSIIRNLRLMLRRKTLYRENTLDLWVEHTISEAP